MIVTGEASGDLHGSHLVKSIQKTSPDFTFCGMGGEMLHKAGVEILFDAAKIAVVGFFEVVSHLKDIIAAQKILRKRLETARPALLILIDFPDFNFLLARKAKKIGIPVFYYISPQVWAWRSGRVKTIAKLVDKIGVILPFEEQFYRDRGVDAHYVGHPLLDSVHSSVTRDDFCGKNNIDNKQKIIGILPGSRSKEIAKLLPVFLEAALLLKNKSEGEPVFLIPRAPTISEDALLDSGVREYRNQLNLKIISKERYDLMASCDIVIAASGTVTLELLLLDTVMVVAYKLSPYTYRLGKLLIDVQYFTLVNLIADKEVVPELLQEEANPKTICEKLFKLLYCKTEIDEMRAGFRVVKEKLGNPGASDRASEIALGIINRK